jgi:polygalacturonase
MKIQFNLTNKLRALFIALNLAVTTASGQSPPSGGFFNVLDYGGKPDGQTKCTDAIRKAIDAATAKGGGTIYFPSGTYLTGPIRLQSHITLFVDAGATLRFSTNFDDYLPMVPSRWEGIAVTNFSPLIYAYRADHIAIVGRGTLDGQGQAWWSALARLSGRGATPTKWQEEFVSRNQKIIAEMNYAALTRGFLRPPFIQPFECSNILIEGITITNSPFWTVTPVYCENVTVRAATITNPTSPNTDGINPDSCRNVHISDCYISVGDDCITIKSGRDADARRIGRPIENVTIANCTMANGHGGVVIGSEMSGGVKNITIANCVFDGTDRGIRMKSTRGRGGVVEDVRVSNIVMRNIREEAMLLTMFYTRTSPEPLSERTPAFRNIHFSGITGDARIACDLTGLEELPIENITFNDIQLETKTGFVMKDAKDIELHNVKVNTESGPVLTANTTDGLELDAVKTAKPHAGTPVIELGQVKNVFVHGCVAAPGTETFLRVSESSAAEVTMEGNQFKQAKTPMQKVSGNQPAR